MRSHSKLSWLKIFFNKLCTIYVFWNGLFHGYLSYHESWLPVVYMYYTCLVFCMHFVWWPFCRSKCYLPLMELWLYTYLVYRVPIFHMLDTKTVLRWHLILYWLYKLKTKTFFSTLLCVAYHNSSYLLVSRVTLYTAGQLAHSPAT